MFFRFFEAKVEYREEYDFDPVTNETVNYTVIGLQGSNSMENILA